MDNRERLPTGATCCSAIDLERPTMGQPEGQAMTQQQADELRREYELLLKLSYWRDAPRGAKAARRDEIQRLLEAAGREPVGGSASD